MKLKRGVYIFVSTILIIIFLASAVFAFVTYQNRFYETKIEHTETSPVTYKAYLKENTMFQEKYRTAGQTIITSIIDHISINFNYADTFSSATSGTLQYYVKGTIYADKSNGESNYWTSPVETLVPEKALNINDAKNISISQSVDIDYTKYNDKLNEFKKEYPLSVDGYLVVELLVQENLTFPEVNESYNQSYRTVSKITIPLSELVIEIVPETSSVDSSQVIFNKKLEKTGLLYKLAIPFMVIMVLLSAVVLIKLIKYIMIRDKTYNSQLNKILSTYDSIIVNVNQLPHIGTISIIEVSSFNELLDAHSEVRQPINFYEDKDNRRAYFVLTNGNLAWKYVLKGKRKKR